jgi:SNF2 family DNA or RNA helicase
MARLEELTKGTSIKGILADSAVTVVDSRWFGSNVIELTYKDVAGRLHNELLYRERELSLEVVAAGLPWSFDGDGALLRLVSEAQRIRLAHLFDPLLAVHTSLIDPLPHQITAVYGEMLTRQPLRYLLADDPGAGKTIMAGLLIKELIARGDCRRCLIVSPGMLVEQWQEELDSKFHLPFEIMTRDKWEASRTGNWFEENPLAICRLDKLSRDEDVQARLSRTDWDLIVVDEAHKMSATFFGGEIKYTKRYHLGRLLSGLTRHFLLMTATPHNGKEEDFQLFLALLDGDRFEGRFRDGVHLVDTSDLMRRLVKERLVTFEGKPLFPERRAATVNYTLSEGEARLYREVTEYVREEFNRAEALASEGRKGTVGFALTILQRRLASSPEAIYQSLRRRRERLERRLREEQLNQRGVAAELSNGSVPEFDIEDLEELDEAPEAEQTHTEERVVDEASAARTILELQAEIAILAGLETLANEVRRSGTDRKWEELSHLLTEGKEMFDSFGHRRKLIIFTEHRDTLNYLAEKIRRLLGRQEAVVTIHGGMGREERRKAQESFSQDREVEILVATDAAGEGINLIRAHLMVNYDLPWNPNRLEQRFGRIHRIGQTEVCHLWNIVASETREGDVFRKLFEKLEQERQALGGEVFDILGQLTFDNRPLRDLLVEAVRYGEQPEVRARLTRVVDEALDRDHLRSLLDQRALANDSLPMSRVREIREEMERAQASRLQPHYISSFFLEAFRRLGGTIHEREPRRWEITHVPAALRARDRQIGTGAALLSRYERITFDKELVSVPGKPLAEFVCPGHVILEAVSDLVRERHRDLLKRGAILVDPADQGEKPRVLFYMEHSILDGVALPDGSRRVVSREMHFVETDASGAVRGAGCAPYLDYRALQEDEQSFVSPILTTDWLRSDLESKVLEYAVNHLVPSHFARVRQRKEDLVDRTLAAVQDRLTKEISYWDFRAEELRQQEAAGRTPRMNWQKARQRADELEARLERRRKELAEERRLAPQPPIVVGGVLVIPAGLLHRPERVSPGHTAEPEARKRVELLAMAVVMDVERMLGNDPSDVSALKRGWDIESRLPNEQRLRFLEVKGRAAGADTVTVTRNEILRGLNSPDSFILALVQVDGQQHSVRYLFRPFVREPDFGVTSVNYDFDELWVRAEDPLRSEEVTG